MLINQKLKNFAQKHKNIIMSVAVNICFLMLVYILNGFKYELSDDWFFSVNIANGNYDFTFCSYFIQLISGIVQKIIYPVNAFMLLQLLLGFIALTSISYVFLDSFGSKKGIVYVLLIESAFALNIYSLITFTKTAAVLISAGGLMIFWAHCGKKSLMYSVFGIIMALLGSFYRFQIFYSVIAIFVFFVFAYIIYQMKEPGIKGFFKECGEFLQLRTVSVLLVLIIAVFSFNSASKMILSSNEELEYYMKYNSLRSSVVDFQLPSFNEEAEKYEAIGISENDIEMLRNWYVDDRGMADIETLREISKIQEGRQTQTDFLVNMIKSFVGYAELLLLAVYVLTVFGILTVYKKKSLWFISLVTFAVGLLYLYLFMIGRCNYRSAFSVWFAATVCLLYSVKFLKVREWALRKKHFLSKYIVLISTLFYIFFFAFGILLVSPTIERTSNVDYPQLESYIASSENKVFALGRIPYLQFRNSTQFDNPMVLTENEAFDKCVYFGTPYYAHPSYNRLLKASGIDNLYTDLADNENLYFVDNKVSGGEIGKLVTYLNEQYINKQNSGKSYYDSELIHEVEEFNIYKIVLIDKK